MAQSRHFQQGSLFKRGKRQKVWVARWWETVVGQDGKTERLRRSEVLGPVADMPTRREAQQVLSDRLRSINSGDYQPQLTWTLKSFIQDRWWPEVQPTIKHSTKQHYDYVVNCHLIPALGDMQLRLITRDSVQGFLSGKLKTGLSWRTVKHVRTTLGTILKAAEDDDLIASNPVPKTRFPRRGPVPEKTPIDPGKIRDLLQALPEPSHSIALLLGSTGMRIGELLALRWRDVDLQTGLIRVRQTVYEGVFDDPKTKRSRRTVPVGKQGIEVLKQWKPSRLDPDALVFSTGKGTPLSRRNLLNRQFKPTCERLGLKGVTWHWLRHATATLSSSAGVPLGAVQELLGHSSSQITREVYLEAVPSDVKNAVQIVEDLILGPKWTQVPNLPEPANSLIN